MQYLWMALFAAGIVAADQLTKFWVVENIALHTQIDAIPGLFHLFGLFYYHLHHKYGRFQL